MISSASTLFLAALVLTTSVFGAPIRPPVAPSEVIARAESVPHPVARAAVVDVQPIHRRSGLGLFSRRSARLLTEREPLPETVEVPVARDLPEQPEVRRRYPRRVYQDYYEKREPQPEPVNVPAPAPVVQKREDRPRAYPRRVYYERYEKRAPSPEPATQIKETTLKVVKTSTFETPEDLAAAKNLQILPDGSNGNTQTTTLLSFSETQTIPTPGSAATPTEIVNIVSGTPVTTIVTPTATPSASSTDSASVVTVTPGAASSTASPSVVTAGDSTSTASPSVVTVTAGSATSTASGSVVTVTAGSPTSTDSASVVTVTGSATSATQSSVTSPSGISTSSAPAATVTSTGGSTTNDNTQPPVDISKPSGGTFSFAPVRRDVIGTTNESPTRRAYSGATWASFVRRQSN